MSMASSGIRPSTTFKALLLNRASQSLLLIDKSKFMRASEVKIGQLSQVTQIIQSDKRQAARDGLTR